MAAVYLLMVTFWPKRWALHVGDYGTFYRAPRSVRSKIVEKKKIQHSPHKAQHLQERWTLWSFILFLIWKNLRLSSRLLFTHLNFFCHLRTVWCIYHLTHLISFQLLSVLILEIQKGSSSCISRLKQYLLHKTTVTEPFLRWPTRRQWTELIGGAPQFKPPTGIGLRSLLAQLQKLFETFQHGLSEKMFRKKCQCQERKQPVTTQPAFLMARILRYLTSNAIFLISQCPKLQTSLPEFLTHCKLLRFNFLRRK